MTGTRIYNAGAIAESTREGTQIDSHVSSSGFMPFKVQAINAHTLSSTGSGIVAVPGAQTISGAFAVTVQVPLVANGAGSILLFRSISHHAHVLTCSLDAAGTLGFVDHAGVVSGSKFTMNQATSGTVAIFMGDGTRYYHIGGHSGSISGT